MTLQYCISCGQLKEFNGDFCTYCGASNKYSKRDLLAVIEQQQIIIDSLEDQLQLTEYVVDTLVCPEYFSNQSVN